MARAPKTADTHHDGMSWITLMPFPALNPLNWWALATPTNALKASLHHTHMALDAWRAGADSWRAMMRAQQDALMGLIEHPEQADGAAAPSQASAEETADTQAAAAEFVRPMLEVTRAYGRVGKAFIVAQRDTMRAFTQQSDTPH